MFPIIAPADLPVARVRLRSNISVVCTARFPKSINVRNEAEKPSVSVNVSLILAMSSFLCLLFFFSVQLSHKKLLLQWEMCYFVWENSMVYKQALAQLYIHGVFHYQFFTSSSRSKSSWSVAVISFSSRIAITRRLYSPTESIRVGTSRGSTVR